MIPAVGQAYSTLDTTVTSANYTAQGELLSKVGTVIAIQSGPLTGRSGKLDVLDELLDTITAEGSRLLAFAAPDMAPDIQFAPLA